LRYSAEYQSTIFKEYAYSLADVGIDRGELAGLTILDYGCADGTFLDFARSEGTDPERLYGVDISPKMVERAVGKGYRAVTIADGKAIYDVRFDLVTMWDTLEHLLDPRAVVEGLKRAISSTTRLLVQTPRIGLLSECLGEAFEHYLPMEHVHLFPRATFTSLFEGMGFEADKLASFGANAPAVNIPAPYKQAFDRLAKTTDQGATQLGLFRLAGPRGM
jgi:2-polyprenyl-3-methyl-5-hydroxy-6-metoxy-1,4-benzoquinol methylase